MSFLIKETKNSNSIIYKALLKYGYSNFSLEIIEYCDPNILIEREQYYIDQLKPEYNILKTAGSSAGFKHTEASIELIRATALSRKPRIISEETKSKISASLLGRTLSKETKLKMKGRIHTAEAKSKIGISNYKVQAVTVTNNQTGVSIDFTTMKKAAEFLGTSSTQVRNYIKSKKLYKGIFTITIKND
jgi:group I intron endonuclease